MKRNRFARASPVIRRRWLTGLAILLVGAFFAVLFWRPTEPAMDSGPIDTRPAAVLPPPPPVSSPFANTRDDARYVGTARCIECHPDQHATYRNSTHARSMSRVDASGEPPD